MCSPFRIVCYCEGLQSHIVFQLLSLIVGGANVGLGTVCHDMVWHWDW
jgi:hypothetical protein